ncbi:MAG: hypothetical protein JSV40_05850 [Deltaproteobacteria bacterium]|nr:MAG: hypothetical protein JSV40_05850 [Deltaproteobacteria bacterium]
MRRTKVVSGGLLDGKNVMVLNAVLLAVLNTCVLLLLLWVKQSQVSSHMKRVFSKELIKVTCIQERKWVR